MFQDVVDEFRTFVLGRHKILDSILPPLIFVIMNAVAGLEIATWSALAAALGFTIYRLIRRQPIGYALGGLGGVLIALLISWLTGRAESYFIPQLITSSLTTIACLVSVLIRRPLVAFTSHVTRRWPLDWYWHDRIRPAYSEVTLFWVVFFGLRFSIQFITLQSVEVSAAGAVNVLMGWPALIMLLIVSYVYGIWRLRNLGGPSVDEFIEHRPPPWEGQRKGF